ncbi:MAG: hypothetical protein HYX75_12965 [Acidobacteria bacterium]|nr:hypothetical protein [Acidobacteriota bacterium]
MNAKITSRFMPGVTAPESGRLVWWDTELHAFGRAVPTVGEYRQEYLAEVAARKKEPQRDRYVLVSKTPTRWSNIPLDQITVSMVQRRFDEYAKSFPIACNRWLASLSAMLQSAWRKSPVSENPASKVGKRPDGAPRTRVLCDDEMTRLLAVVDALRPHDPALRRVIIETGSCVRGFT